MKKIVACLLLLFISNITFSQNQSEQNIPEKAIVFKFYPNPALENLYILGTNKIKSIELMNVLGSRIAFYQFNKSIIKIDVSELKSGIYLILATDENNLQETKKVFIK